MSEYFKYTSAIVRNMSRSLPETALRMDSTAPKVDFDKAVQQKKHYNQTLRDLGLQVIVMEADDALPDCVFVEDTVVVIGKKALLTNPGHPSRRPEVSLMKKTLENMGKPIELFDMSSLNASATMDGGDVLFTGKEIFVGISSRTNRDGYKVLDDVFSEFPVTPIVVKDGLHLKSFCSMANEDDLLVSAESNMLNELKQTAKFSYNYLEVAGNLTGVNCLYIDSPTKGKTIIYPHHDTLPEAKMVYDKLDKYNRIPMDLHELTKVDGALTCSSILLAL